MAKLIENRKRSERVAAVGHPFGGTMIVWEPSVLTPGHSHASGEVFTLGLGEYRLEMTEIELMSLMEDYMGKIVARRRAEEKRKQENGQTN